MTFFIFRSLVGFSLGLLCITAWAGPLASFITPPVRTKIEKFFDFNRDGFLSQHEQGCFNSYREFHWPLANTKKKLRFDENGNHLLEPTEWERYEEWKKKKGKPRIKQ